MDELRTGFPTLMLTEEELNSSPEAVFSKDKKLGEGAYGEVYMGKHVRTGTPVAIKILPFDKEMKLAMDAEIDTMKDYDNIWIVMEYCMGGAVSDIMDLTGLCLSEDQISQVCLGVLQALQIIHSKNRIHRDIKSGNILLNDQGDVKLADFGVSGQLADASSKRNTITGTPYWMAPEVIQEEGYGVLADIWSLGITCIELAEGLPPYHDLHPMKAIFMIPSRPPPTLAQPREFSPAFNDFIARCLTKDPKDRPSATELLEDPFIKSKHHPNSTLYNLVREISNLNGNTNNNPPASPSTDDLSLEADFKVQQFDDSTIRRKPRKGTSKRFSSTSLKEISVAIPINIGKQDDNIDFSPITPAPKDSFNHLNLSADILGKCVTRENFHLLCEGLKYQCGLDMDRKERDYFMTRRPIDEALNNKK